MRNLARFLTTIEIWPVILFAGAGIISTELLACALAGAVVFWPIRWVANGRPSHRTPIDWAVALMALTLPVTLWATTSPQETTTQVMRLLLGISLYYTVANWVTTFDRLRWIFFGAILLGVALAGAALLSVRWVAGSLPETLSGWFTNSAALAADPVNPNVIAGYLVMFVPMPLALALFGWEKSTRTHEIQLRLVALFAALPGVVMVWWSQSRGATLALTLSILLLVSLRWRWGWIGLVVTLLSMIVFVLVNGLTPVVEMLASNITLGGVEGRMEVWSRAIYMVQDFPYTGIGMGTFTQVADRMYPFFRYDTGTIAHAHNLYLQVAVDLGIAGLVAWCGAIIAIFMVSLRTFRSGQAGEPANRWLIPVSAGLMAGVAAMTLHGITDAVTWGQVRAAPLVWALWGIAAAGANLIDG